MEAAALLPPFTRASKKQSGASTRSPLSPLIPRNQPGVCQWNLMMLAKAFALAGLIDREALPDVLDAYADALAAAHSDAMRRKLGLATFDPELYGELMVLMQRDAPDYTNTWRALASVRGDGGQSGLTPELRAALGGDELPEVWQHWV